MVTNSDMIVSYLKLLPCLPSCPTHKIETIQVRFVRLFIFILKIWKRKGEMFVLYAAQAANDTAKETPTCKSIQKTPSQYIILRYNLSEKLFKT